MSAACSPTGCGAFVAWIITSSNPNVLISPSSGLDPCPGNTRLITVTALGCAQTGTTTLNVTGATFASSTCATTATVTVTPCPPTWVNPGQITADGITVSPAPACPGGVVTFMLDNVEDSGGTKAQSCCIATTTVPIDAVTPAVAWTITPPVPLADVSGSGSVASTIAPVPGVYSVTFTATVNRECPAPPLTVGPASVTVEGGVAPDIDGDADHDGIIAVGGQDEALEDQLPGIIVLCNADDDDEDGYSDT